MRPTRWFLFLCLVLCVAPAGTAQPETERADLIIANGLVLTMDSGRRIHDPGTVVVRDGRLVAVGGPDLAERYTAPETIDAGGDIVMPGMINLHSHLSMVAFRGLGETAMGNILTDVMFPLEKALLNRTLIRVAARQAAMELALGGVTLITDMYYHEDEVADAVAGVGLRGVLGETIIGFPVVDAPEPYGGLDYARTYTEDYRDHPLITPALAPHAPYTVNSDILKKVKALSDETGAPILIHLAEFEREEIWSADTHEAFNGRQSEIAYLADLDFLGPKVLGAHMIYTDAADREILARHDVGIAHNPKANPKYGERLAPAWEQVQAGIDVGLGTDGPMTSNQLDVLTVMRHAAYAARLRQRSHRPFPPQDLVHMATLGGAEALHMDDQLGSLEAGKHADIVIIDVHAANMQPLYNPYAALVFQAYPGNVRTTIVAGQPVVRDGVVQTVDRDAHDKAWRAVTQRVIDVAGELNIPGLVSAGQ